MKKDTPYVYVVAWDDTIVKIGYSARKRWRVFTARGAQIVTLVPFESGLDALRCESALHKAAMASWKWAFRTREEARPYLGRDGAGWVECYQATAETARHFAASIVTAHRDAHRDDALPRTMRVTDAEQNRTEAGAPPLATPNVKTLRTGTWLRQNPARTETPPTSRSTQLRRYQ